MARGGESVSDLYIRLGLSYDELESGFVNAERTIRDNMTRLSRENQIIDLQARVEIAGLDETADAEQILQIRTRALNQQLEHQRDRVRLASAELANMTDRTGENSDQTQRARLALERERLALAQLEEQLASLNETQEDTSEGFGGLDSILDRIPPEVKMVGSAFIGVTTAMIAAGAASKELIEKWRELQNTSYNLNMSVNDTKNFLRHMKLAGGEIDDFQGYIRGITDAWTKGEWDDPEFLTLRKWGATIVDATGRLKNFQDITEEVYQAYLKAKAAGEEIEFLQLTGGESGVTDAIQYLERYAEAKADAAKIFDAGLDPDEMHDAERSLNLLTMQMDEFKDATVDLITPATTQAMKGLFDVFRAGTEIIADNKDELRKWASSFAMAAAQAIGGKPLASVLFSAEDDKGLDAHTKKVLEAGQNLERAHAKLKAQIEGDPTTQYGWQRLTDLRDEIDDINAEIEHFNHDYDLSIAQLELWRKRALRQNDLSKKERQAIEEDFSAQLEQIEQERAQTIKEAREDVAAELGTDLDQQLLDFQRQKKDWISAGMDAAEAEILAERLKVDAIEELEKDFAAERDALRNTNLQNQLDAINREKEAWIDKGVSEAEADEFAQLRIAKVREEYLQKAQEMLQEAADREYGLTHDAFEKQLYDVERWKQAQLEKAQTAEEVAATIADAAMKEAEAFTRAVDQMQGAVRNIQEDIARKTMSPKAYDEYAAQNKYREYLEKYPKSVADEWFRIEMARISKRAAEEEERYRKAVAAEEERYRQARQRGDDAERRTIENPYTKSPGLGTSPLVNADSRALAAMGVLEKYGISAEDLKRELNSTATAQQAYQNVLQRLTDKMNEASGNVGDAAKETADGVGKLGDAATAGADEITSAAETVRRALEYAEAIEKENAQRRRDFQPEDEEPRIPIEYGNEFDTYAPSIPLDKRIPIEYGNEDYIPPSTFEEPLQSSAEMLHEKAEAMAEAMDSEPIANFQQEVTNSAGATQNLADAATTAGTSTNALSEKMLQTADTLDALREKIANMPLQQPPQQPQQYDNMSDAIDDALKATATIGELTALGGLATLQPEIALLGAGMEALADTAQTLRDLANHIPAQSVQPVQSPQATPTAPQTSTPTAQPATVDLSAIQQTLATIQQDVTKIAQEPPLDLTPIQQAIQQLSTEITPALAEINTSIQGLSTELSSKLGEIAQGISGLAQSANQNKQPPPVNVNVNPNINLGGAYVFDNDMKHQLTDDIATEVANAVTSAVNSATRQTSYDYGN